MQLRSLNHLLEMVRALARPGEIDVLGSSSLLGSDPTLGDPGGPLELSMDADLLLRDRIVIGLTSRRASALDQVQPRPA